MPTAIIILSLTCLILIVALWRKRKECKAKDIRWENEWDKNIRHDKLYNNRIDELKQEIELLHNAHKAELDLITAQKDVYFKNWQFEVKYRATEQH